MASEPDGELSTPEKRPAPRSGVAGAQRRRGRATGCSKVQACADVPRAKRQRSGRCKAAVDESICEQQQAQPQSARRRSTGPGRPPASAPANQPQVAREARTKASHIALPTQTEDCLITTPKDDLLHLAEPGGGHTIVQLTGQLPGKEGRIASWMQIYSSAGRSPHHGQPAYASQDDNFLLYYSSDSRNKGWWLGHMVDGTTSSAALAFLPHGKHRWWVLEEGGTPCEAQVSITAVPPPQIPDEVATESDQAPFRNGQRQQQAKPPKPKNFQPGAFWTYFGGKGVSLWQQQVEKQPSERSNIKEEVCIDADPCVVVKSTGKARNEAVRSSIADAPSALLALPSPQKSKSEISSTQATSRSNSPTVSSSSSSSTKQVHQHPPTLPRSGHSEPGAAPMSQDQIAKQIAQMEAKLPRKLSPSVAWRPPRKCSAKEIGLVLAPQELSKDDKSLLSEADARQQDIFLRSLAKYTMFEPTKSLLEPTKRKSSQSQKRTADVRNFPPDLMRIAIGAH